MSYEIDPDYVNPDTRNVIDEFKGLSEEEIKRRLTHHNFSICVVNLQRSINVGSILRSAHLLGCANFVVAGLKKWDVRADVGARKYTNMHHVKEDGINNWCLENQFTPILVDYIEGRSQDITCIKNYPLSPLFIFGSEKSGLPNHILTNNWPTIHIPQFGATRSFNVSNAAAIIMWDWFLKGMA